MRGDQRAGNSSRPRAVGQAAEPGIRTRNPNPESEPGVGTRSPNPESEPGIRTRSPNPESDAEPDPDPGGAPRSSCRASRRGRWRRPSRGGCRRLRHCARPPANGKAGGSPRRAGGPEPPLEGGVDLECDLDVDLWLSCVLVPALLSLRSQARWVSLPRGCDGGAGGRGRAGATSPAASSSQAGRRVRPHAWPKTRADGADRSQALPRSGRPPWEAGRVPPQATGSAVLTPIAIPRAQCRLRSPLGPPAWWRAVRGDPAHRLGEAAPQVHERRRAPVPEV